MQNDDGMEGIDAMNAFDTISKIVISLAGLVISWMLYRLSNQQRTELWLRTLKEIHEAFWDDPVMADVRFWLADDQAYAEIKPILQKRKDIDAGKLGQDGFKKSEYEVIEKLDKFFNLVLRVAAINPEFEKQRDLWQKLFGNYWVAKISTPQRVELHWYANKFYSDVFEHAGAKGKVMAKADAPKSLNG